MQEARVPSIARELRSHTLSCLSLKGCSSNYTNTWLKFRNHLWHWGKMVGKSRQQSSPITSQAGERSWPGSRTGLQLWCSFQHEQKELPGINWLRLGRGKEQLRASDSGQVNWRSQMLPHELLSIPHTHSHSLADMIKQSQHCFPPGRLLPHESTPSLTLGSWHSLSTADNCDETYFLPFDYAGWIYHKLSNPPTGITAPGKKSPIVSPWGNTRALMFSRWRR